MTASASQRTIDMSGILTETFRVINSNFYLILFFILATKIPVFLFRLLLPWQDFLSIYGITINIFRRGFEILNTLVELFFLIGVAYTTQKFLDGKTESLSNVIAFSFSRFMDVVWTYLALILIGVVKTLALLIPGIIFVNASSFALFASALRQKKGSEAIHYSENLVRGQWWNVFWYQTFFSLIIIGINLPIWYIARNSHQIDFFTWLAHQLMSGALGIFGIVWQVLFFRRVEASKESWESNAGQEFQAA